MTTRCKGRRQGRHSDDEIEAELDLVDLGPPASTRKRSSSPRKVTFTRQPSPVKSAANKTMADHPSPVGAHVTTASVLHVPDCSYSLNEIHFVLWYTFTTTLNPDKIASLFNTFFKPQQPIDRWAIADIVFAIETRWERDNHSFGDDFRLVRPTAHGTCPCDFDIDCVDVKRTRKSRQNERYLHIATTLWDQEMDQLVICPHGRRKGDKKDTDTRSGATAKHHPARPPVPRTWYDIRSLYHTSIHLLSRVYNNTHSTLHAWSTSRAFIHILLSAGWLYLALHPPSHLSKPSSSSFSPLWIFYYLKHAVQVAPSQMFAVANVLPKYLTDTYTYDQLGPFDRRLYLTLLLDCFCSWVGLFVLYHVSVWFCIAVLALMLAVIDATTDVDFLVSMSRLPNVSTQEWHGVPFSFTAQLQRWVKNVFC